VNKFPPSERDAVVQVWTYFEGSSQGSEVEILREGLDSLKTSINQILAK